jgi:hypothetical protein
MYLRRVCAVLAAQITLYTRAPTYIIILEVYITIFCRCVAYTKRSR